MPRQLDPAPILAALDRHGVRYVLVGGLASEITRYGPMDLAMVPDGTEGYDDLARSMRKVTAFGIRVPGERTDRLK